MTKKPEYMARHTAFYEEKNKADKILWLGLAVTVLLITMLMMRGLERSAIISLAKDDCKVYRGNSKFYQSCIQERIREMKLDSLLNG